ncbi:Fructosamine kinase-domain-containing protein [Xylariomycetidae sp. FL0641]|nr:Fructosamine kinase-domain-containing protein [Xylariomycetidae sp. FL0641]
MVQTPPEFTAATIPADQAYAGTEVDANVRAALPDDVQLKWVATYAASFWALCSKIDTERADGSTQSYFLKVYTTANAAAMVRGEYEGSAALHAALPANVPRPIAWGRLARAPAQHFYLGEFVRMRDRLPGTAAFAGVIARLHRTPSPTGRFGFAVPTFGGDHGTDTRWLGSWAAFFARTLRDTLDRERAVHGPHAALDRRLRPRLLDVVVPRLLRPLETGGRRVRPVLLHGDLWHGNVGVAEATGEPVLYDPCALYGHNEYEFAPFRASRYLTRREHVDAYFELVGVSEPAEDLEDRLALYAVRCDLLVSITWPENKQTRQLAIDGIKRLVDKYCPEDEVDESKR